MKDIKLPTRFTAYDAEATSDGWAIDVEELAQWASSVLQECTEDSVARQRIMQLLEHIS